MNAIRKKLLLAGNIKPANEEEVRLVAEHNAPSPTFLVEVAFVNRAGYLRAAGALHTPEDLDRFLSSACEWCEPKFYLLQVEEVLVHPYGRNPGNVRYVLDKLHGKGRLVSKEELEDFENAHRVTIDTSYYRGELEGSPVPGISLTDAYGIDL